MDTTTNLALPYIAAAQAQKHVTHNEAIRALDAIVHLAVLDQTLTAPPVSPAEGDRHIVAATASGSWTGKEGQIAAWQDGAWMFYSPREGWVSWISSNNSLVSWDGTAWVSTGATSLNPASGGLVGINATADTTNRLSLSAAASLFNHEGAGHQIKVNKNAVADTASLLYQTGFSGRAEMGLTGDDNYHFKVSPDGSTWKEAIQIDAATGAVSFPNTNIGGTSSDYYSNRTVANLSKFTNGLNRLLQYGEQKRINIFGDSVTLGAGGYYQRNSPGEMLAQELARRGIPASANLFGMSFGTPAQVTAFEPRLTFTGTWGGWTQVQGKSTFRTTGAGATMAYAPGRSFDAIDLYWYKGGGFGSEGNMIITIDGGAASFSTPTSGGSVTSQTISQAGSGGIQKTTITIASAGVHTIEVTNDVTGAIEIYGFEPYTAGIGEVLIRCMGASGLTSTALATPLRLQSIYKMPCDLYIFCAGINDWVTGVPVATYTANIAAIKANMQVIVTPIMYWTPPPSQVSTTPIATQQPYVDALKADAGTSVVVADVWQRYLDRGSQEILRPAGFYNDNVHPSALGNDDLAKVFGKAIADIADT